MEITVRFGSFEMYLIVNTPCLYSLKHTVYLFLVRYVTKTLIKMEKYREQTRNEIYEAYKRR